MKRKIVKYNIHDFYNELKKNYSIGYLFLRISSDNEKFLHKIIDFNHGITYTYKPYIPEPNEEYKISFIYTYYLGDALDNPEYNHLDIYSSRTYELHHSLINIKPAMRSDS